LVSASDAADEFLYTVKSSDVVAVPLVEVKKTEIDLF
jgi:hypothetical protein